MVCFSRYVDDWRAKVKVSLKLWGFHAVVFMLEMWSTIQMSLTQGLLVHLQRYMSVFMAQCTHGRRVPWWFVGQFFEMFLNSQRFTEQHCFPSAAAVCIVILKNAISVNWDNSTRCTIVNELTVGRPIKVSCYRGLFKLSVLIKSSLQPTN